jgi:hypothetical protein
MQSSTTTTLPTRTRPFESQQHPLAKTHWSMLHRRVRKARGLRFNCYTWRWMMSSSRTSPSRSLLLQQSRHVPDVPFMSTELRRRPSSLPQRQNKGSPPLGAICCRLARLAAAGGLPALSWSGVIWRAYVALAFPALHWESPLEDLESAQLRRCTLPDRLGVALVIDRDLAREDESHHHLYGCSDMHIFCSHWPIRPPSYVLAAVLCETGLPLWPNTAYALPTWGLDLA